MKLIASGDTCSAARVRSPSFSRSSSSTTTTMRPARISSTAPGTSIKGASKVRSFEGIGSSYCRLEPGDKGTMDRGNQGETKAPHKGGAFGLAIERALQRRFDLESPGFQKRLRDILGILVPAGPLPKTGGPDILIRCELELLDDLFKGGHSRHYRADGLRLAPVRIS